MWKYGMLLPGLHGEFVCAMPEEFVGGAGVWLLLG
jgi:hypothetical protein